MLSLREKSYEVEKPEQDGDVVKKKEKGREKKTGGTIDGYLRIDTAIEATTCEGEAPLQGSNPLSSYKETQYRNG